jgi:hypothetical protein
MAPLGPQGLVKATAACKQFPSPNTTAILIFFYCLKLCYGIFKSVFLIEEILK